MQLVVQTTWGHLVAWYLFLAGAGAGLYVISIGVKLFRLNDSFAKPAYYASPFIVIVASVLLLLDLGQPLRALLAVLRPHASMISVGTVILSLFISLSLYQGVQTYLGRKLTPVWDYVGLALAVGTATYTGLLLGVVKAIPFWNNPLLPLLFLVSALSSGLGALLVLSATNRLVGSEHAGLRPDILRLDYGLILTEIALLSLLLFISWNGGIANEASVRMLVWGGLAAPFWLLIVGIGIGVPLWLKAKAKLESESGLLLCGLCLMAGALALRYSVVFCGIWIPLGR